MVRHRAKLELPVSTIAALGREAALASNAAMASAHRDGSLVPCAVAVDTRPTTSITAAHAEVYRIFMANLQGLSETVTGTSCANAPS